MEAAFQRTREAGIPFDAQWGDIDVMDRQLDFTINPTEFAALPEFANTLHEVGKHLKHFSLSDWDEVCDDPGPVRVHRGAAGGVPGV